MDTMQKLQWTVMSFLIFLGTYGQAQQTSQAVEEFLAMGVEPDFWDSGEGIEIFQGSMTDLTTIANPTMRLLEFNETFGLNYISALDCDPFNKSLYILESQTRSLYRVDNLDLTFQNLSPFPVKIHEGISDTTSSIAFDWITKTIYWTDHQFGWIGMQPVYTQDPTMYKILFHNLNYPVGIAVDPIKGLLFWYDMPRGRGSIQRSTLSGEDRQVILHQSVGYINDMAVDVDEERIYWVDSSRGTIESMTYYGNSRRKIRTVPGYTFTSIIVAKDDVCIVEPNNYFLACFRKLNGENSLFRSYWWNAPNSLTLYDKSMLKTEQSDACKDNQCQHFCSIRSATEHKCMCKDGYKLNTTDYTSCIADHYLFGRGILIANGTHVCMSEVRSLAGNSLMPTCITSNMENATHLVADAKTKTVYFYDIYNKQISYHVLQDDSQARVPLAVTGNVSGITFDWIDKELFWSESDTGIIKVVSLTNNNPTAEIYSGMSNVFSITAAPHNKTLFWITRESIDSTTNAYKIYSAKMDGTEAKVVVNSSDLNEPTALYYDVSTNRLFWLDRNVLHTTTIDGEDRRTFMNYVVGSDLIIYKRYAIWRDSRNTLQARSYMLSQQASLTSSEFGEIVGMCLFDETLETTERGPCSAVPNGGCEDICLPSDSGPVCKCDFGYHLNTTDMKSCYSEYFKTNFFLITDGAHRRLYQVSMNGSNIATLDLPDVFYPTGTFYHKTDDVLYITDASNQAIRRVHLDGTNFTTVLQFAGKTPERMTVDYSTGTVYYSVSDQYDRYGGYIGAISTKYLIHRTVLDGMEIPRGIAVFPSEGYMFVADYGRYSSYIYRTWMDGSNVETIVSSNIRSPLGLAVDYTTKKVYWVDNYYDRLESCMLNGDDRNVVMETSIGYLSDLIIHGSSVYYVGHNTHKIGKVDKVTGAEQTFMDDVPELGRIETINLIPGDDQPISMICRDRNGDCGKFCFPSPQGRRCGCADGVVLLEDMVTCTGDAAVCTRMIPYGNLKPDINCYAIENYTCEYECADGFRKNISHNIRQIKCLSTGEWNHPVDTLCEVITCPREFPNGKISPNCNNDIGTLCSYTCDDDYIRTQSLIGCQSNGNWNYDISTLCKKKVVCNAPIPNGKLTKQCTEADKKCFVQCDANYRLNPSINTLHCLDDGQFSSKVEHICQPITCQPEITNVKWNTSNCIQPLHGIVVGMKCKYTCAEGYKINVVPAVVECLVNGRWDKSSQQLCTPILCNDATPNAVLSPNIIRQAGKSFNYKCKDLYEKHTDIYKITCLADGTWNVNAESLCKSTKSTTGPVKAPSTQSESLSAGASAGLTLAICVLVAIIVAVALYMFVIKRRHGKARFVESPNVRFNGNNEFHNPTAEIGGVSNPQTYTEMQPPQNPVYDNIPEKNGSEMKSVSEIGNPYHKF